MRGRAVLTVVALAATAFVSTTLGPNPVEAATPPDGFVDEAIESFSTPTTVEWLPGNRIVVLEKGGDLHVGRPGEAFEMAVSLSVCFGSEEGLLGLTADPAFGSNGYVYIYYTHSFSGDCVNRVSRFTMSDDAIDTGTEVILLDNIASTGTNHNGGDLDVGEDGYLYVAIGDAGTDPRGDSGGGGANDAAQDLSILNGSIARITLDGDPAPGNPFSGPGTVACATLGTTNTLGTECQEIYAWGLRNPYRFAFDRDAGSNRFYINDVGQSTYEEVSVGASGDFGWPTREGFCDQGQVLPCDASDPDVIDPIAAYGRADGTYITAGAFVPDNLWPEEYDDLYLFADGGSGDIWQMDDAGNVDYAAPFATGAFGLTDMTFGFDEDGEMVLYYVGEGIGLRKITPQEDPGPDPGPDPEPEPADLLWLDPITPVRAYDTGDGTGVPGGQTGDVAATVPRTIELDAPDDAQAVLVNITMADTAGSGNVRTWETGTPRPQTSSVNAFGAGATVGNAAVVALADDGSFLLESSVRTRIVVDVMAWMRTTTDGTSSEGRFVALDAARLIDTREPSGMALESGSTNPWFGDATLADDDEIGIGVNGQVGVPSDAGAVVLSVAAIPKSGQQGRATLTAADAPTPETSSVNVTPGEVRNNLVLVPLDVGLENVTAVTKNLDHLVIDVLGYVTAASAPESGSGLFATLAPTRIVDTRDPLGFDRLAGGAPATLALSDIDGAAAIVQTITVTNPAGDGWIVAHATDDPPVVSNLNYRAGQTRGTLAFTLLADDSTERFTARVATDVVVDMVGYFTE